MTTKKVLLIIFGGVAVLFGAGLGIGGAVLLAVVGSDSTFSTDATPVSTPTRALVSEATSFDNTSDGGSGGSGSEPAPRIGATVRVTVSSATGGAVFVGLAPSSAVQSYLGGASYEEMRDLQFGPLRFTPVRHDGTGTPEPPAGRPDWVREVSGSGEQVLEFDLGETGTDQVVIMNADASPDVAVSLRIGVRVPVLRGVAIGLLVGSAPFLLGGLALIVWGIRAKGRPAQPVGYGPYGPQPAYGQPPQQAWGPPAGPPPGYGYPPGAGFPPPDWSPPGTPPGAAVPPPPAGWSPEPPDDAPQR